MQHTQQAVKTREILHPQPLQHATAPASVPSMELEQCASGSNWLKSDKAARSLKKCARLASSVKAGLETGRSSSALVHSPSGRNRNKLAALVPALGTYRSALGWRKEENAKKP